MIEHGTETLAEAAAAFHEIHLCAAMAQGGTVEQQAQALATILAFTLEHGANLQSLAQELVAIESNLR